MPVPALFRYRRRFLLGRSSEGPHQVVSRSPAALKEPNWSIGASSRDPRTRVGVNRAWAWRMAAELFLLLLPSSRPFKEPVVLRILGSFALEGSCSSSPHVFPRQRLRGASLCCRRGFHRLACRRQQASRENRCARHSAHFLPPFRLVTRQGRRPLPVLSALCRRHSFRQGPAGNRTGYIATPSTAHCGPCKAWTVVLPLHFGRTEFHRQALRSARLALIHNQSLWNASETQRLGMKPD